MPAGRTGSRNYRHRSCSSSSNSSPENKAPSKVYSTMDKRLPHHLPPHHRTRSPIKHGHSSRPLESKHRLLSPMESSLRKRSISPPRGPMSKRRMIDRYTPPPSAGSNFSKRPSSPRRNEESTAGKIAYTREDLEKITIDIRRNVKEPSPTVRKIVNPCDIKIVRRKEEGGRPLFEREEIKLAVVDLREDKLEHHSNKRLKYAERSEMSSFDMVKGGSGYRNSFENGAPPGLTLSERWQTSEKKPLQMPYKYSDKPRYQSPPYSKERRYSSPDHKKDNRRMDPPLKDSHPPERYEDREFHKGRSKDMIRFRKESYHGDHPPPRKLGPRMEPPRDRPSNSRRSPGWDNDHKPRRMDSYKEPGYFENDREDFRGMRGRPMRGRMISRGRGFRPARGGLGYRGSFRSRGSSSSFHRGGGGGPIYPRGYYSKSRSPGPWKHDLYHKMSPDRKSVSSRPL